MSRARTSQAGTAYLREYLAAPSDPLPASPPLPWANHRVGRGSAPYSTWRSTPESIARVRAEVARRAHDAGASEAQLSDIRIAVSEACTNAVLHAFVTPRQRARTFAVSTAVEDDTFDVWILDGGRGAV